MDAALFRRVAERCRELMARTEIEAVKEQLQIWANEFDQRAEEVESEKADPGATFASA